MPIKAAMFPFSTDFISGCKIFSELAKSSTDEQEIRIFNTSCIINAVSFLEAKLNEQVSVAQLCFDDDDDDENGKAWSVIQDIQKKLSIQEKWNLISTRTNGQLWEAGSEPFQSFETIVSLRNELIHYKGDLLAKDEAPNRKIKGLMAKLGVSSDATWIESDCSSWVTDLLKRKELSKWVCERIDNFNNIYHDLLHGNRREIAGNREIGDIYGSSRVARKKFDRRVGKLHTYIRPLVEAG